MSAPAPVRHGGLGIASFILSLGGGLLMFGLVVLAGLAELSTPGGMDETAPATVMLGLGIFGAGLLEIVALALGVAGVLQRDRRRTFSILGMIFAGGVLLCTAALMLIGLLS
ncbi:hypothetical protein [Stenotrophomonas sp.]|uniref:hypothetical protein n=1 Tax=Stenotrophomonas sp. TaxID=69392 RepID=UPI002FC8B53D